MQIQHLEVSAGENRTLTLYARDAVNLPADLTSKTVAWYIGRSPWRPGNSHALVTKVGTVTGAAGGVFTVPVLPADTQYFAGDYEHFATTTDGSGNVAAVCKGRFRVLPALVP